MPEYEPLSWRVCLCHECPQCLAWGLAFGNWGRGAVIINGWGRESSSSLSLGWGMGWTWMTAWTFPSPWCSWGRDRKSFMQGETPRRLSLSVDFCKLLVFRRNHLRTSGPAVYELALSPPKGRSMLPEETYLLLFLLNFPFWLRRWWGRRMSLPCSLFWSSLVQRYRYFFSFSSPSRSFSSPSRSFSLFLCSEDWLPKAEGSKERWIQSVPREALLHYVKQIFTLLNNFQ